MNLRNNGQQHLKCLVVLTLIQEYEKQIIPVNISIVYLNSMHGFGCVRLIDTNINLLKVKENIFLNKNFNKRFFVLRVID